MVNPWIAKGWQMQRQAECFPNVTILKAALWLEKRHIEQPDHETAAIISLHYLVLALRKQAERREMLFEHYMSQALKWRREAICRLAQSSAKPEAFDRLGRASNQLTSPRGTRHP
jgi:hypothetical protein